MKRKGVFFLVDVCLAILVLFFLGFSIISVWQGETKSSSSSTGQIAQNTANFLTSLRIKDICEPPSCVCGGSTLNDLCTNGDIVNYNKTMLGYLGELYNRSERLKVNNLFHELVIEKGLIDTKIYDVTFRIEGTKLYNTTPDFSKSENVISSKKIVLGLYENEYSGEVNYFGPYLAEIIVYDKNYLGGRFP